MIPKKSESVNLESKRSIFFETGLIIALLFVLLAFNWKTYDKKVIELYQRTGDDSPVELVQITVQKPPEMPRVQKPLVVHAINIVDNESPVDESFVFSAEIDPTDSVMHYRPSVPVMKEEEESYEEVIFKVVESMPVFPGGEKELYAFLRNNMRYPEIAKEIGISGKVYLTFVVEKDGSITDVRLLRGIGGGCDEEALRVINMMPDWIPGKQRNIPVRVQFILDVKFTLSQI
jgi:protein TonB